MNEDRARIETEASTERRARILGLPYIDVSRITDKKIYPDLLSNDELYKFKIIPIEVGEHHISFGILTTTSQQTMQNLRQQFLDQSVSFSIISDIGFKDYMQLYDPPKKIVYQDINISQSAHDKSIIEDISATLEQVRADDLLAYLVKQAHMLNSSDIHLENQDENVRIRFRIDGVLHSIAKLSKEKYRVLVSAIATEGNISTSSDEPQQGHISLKTKMADGASVDINVRLESVQTILGMDIVMRMFNMNAEMYQLANLGLSNKERAVVDNIIAKPSGLVLVVGPTGSGKTTTLYSMLNSLNNDERKIITIEDPVEYQFSGITQISVTNQKTKDINYAEKLKAVLRLDPDIVMVGEIRDNDTAKTALQASLTGHLVLSTFHAGSASAALTRLMDVIGQNPLFVSAVRLVMAQRLIRRLDESSKVPINLDQNTLTNIQKVIDTLPEGVERPNISKVQFYKPGQSTENPFGYHGQLAIREQFVMTGEIRTLLEHPNGVLSTEEIEMAAVRSGMTTMLQDGILKVCEGLTTIDEVIRVVG